MNMTFLINQLIIENKIVSFISSPIIEMICAFIIDQSKYFIFTFIHQFIGDSLLYPIAQILIILVPWIMLGHGAFRHENSRFKGNTYGSLENFNSSNNLPSKKNSGLVSFLFAAFIFLQFFNL